jgi:hypothetical protein
MFESRAVGWRMSRYFLAMTNTVACLLIAILLNGAALAQSQQPSHNGSQPTQSEYKDRAHREAVSSKNQQQNKDQRAKEAQSSEFIFEKPVTDALLVLVTALLVLVTSALVYYTKVLAKVADAVERPRVRLSRLRFDRFGGNIRDHGKLPIITVGFKNYGRTVAIVTRVRVCIAVTGTLPKSPDYSDGYVYIHAGEAIAPDAEFEPRPKWFIEFDKFAPEKETPAAACRLPFRAGLYVYGYISYLDHLNKERIHGFVGLWMPPDTGNPSGDSSGHNFLIGGPKAYAYDK